jgi:hypothetical protein
VGLTSPDLPYLLVALAFAMLLGIVVFWPWLGRRGLWRLGLRLLSLCVLQALVLGLIFVVVNRSGDFYSSWSDLLGTDQGGSASVVAAGTTPDASHELLRVTHRSVVRLTADRFGGILENVRVYGQLSGITAAGSVYLPAEYFARGVVRDFPVLLVISDAGAAGRTPYSGAALAQTAADEIAAGQMQPLIVVTLPATVGAGDKSCLNLGPTFRTRKPVGPTGKQIGPTVVRVSPTVQGETFFAEDVPTAIDAAYRAGTQAADWALLGDESGGYCALQLAMDNSYVFSAAVVPRGSYTLPPGIAAKSVSLQIREQDDLVWQLTNQPMQPVSVLFAGPGRAVGPGQASAFVTLARPPMHVSTTQLLAGGQPLARVLAWVSATIGSHRHQAVSSGVTP